MKRALMCGLVLVAATLAGAPVRADWVEYRLPGTPLVVLIPVKEPPQTVAGGVTILKHDFGTLYVDSKDVIQKYKAPTVSVQFDKKLNQALAKKNAAALLEVAKWAVQRGLVRDFHATVNKALEFDPNNAEAKRIVELRKRLDQGCVESSKQEAEMRKLIRDPNM